MIFIYIFKKKRSGLCVCVFFLKAENRIKSLLDYGSMGKSTSCAIMMTQVQICSTHTNFWIQLHAPVSLELWNLRQVDPWGHFSLSKKLCVKRIESDRSGCPNFSMGVYIIMKVLIYTPAPPKNFF